jgi:hypothetical protein
MGAVEVRTDSRPHTSALRTPRPSGTPSCQGFSCREVQCPLRLRSAALPCKYTKRASIEGPNEPFSGLKICSKNTAKKLPCGREEAIQYLLKLITCSAHCQWPSPCHRVSGSILTRVEVGHEPGLCSSSRCANRSTLMTSSCWCLAWKHESPCRF